MLKRLYRHKGGCFGLLLVCIVVLMGLLAPVISPEDPYAIDMEHALEPPSITHPLGTDFFGRDILTRIIYGARISLIVSVLSRIIAIALGTLLGLVAGYSGGRLDNFIMRLADVTLAYPALLLLIAVVAVVGPWGLRPSRRGCVGSPCGGRPGAAWAPCRA